MEKVAMLRDKAKPEYLSEFMNYLAAASKRDQDRLPPLADISGELDVSVASLREQMEVARALGLVEVRPKTGIRRLDYTFKPAVIQSLAYAIAIDPTAFECFSDLRKNLEAAYWYQAVSLLTAEDHLKLQRLVVFAQEKMHGEPAQIPHAEHKELHLLIYRRLGNPFLNGMLEAYWEIYEVVGLNFYTDIAYLERVWMYHQKMVEAVCAGNFDSGYQALMDHMELIFQRSKSISRQKFE